MSVLSVQPKSRLTIPQQERKKELFDIGQRLMSENKQSSLDYHNGIMDFYNELVTREGLNE